MHVGDAATTGYNGTSTTVMITAVNCATHSQSGISFQVWPPLKNCHRDTWFDADWFEPVHDPAEHMRSISAE